MKTGSREEVLKRMARHAILYNREMINAFELLIAPSLTIEPTQQMRDEIEDFMELGDL